MKILIPAVLFLAVACHGKSSNVLHLENGNITEQGYRQDLRLIKAENLIAWSAVCQQYKGLDKQALAGLLSEPGSATAHTTPVPNQKAVPQDRINAAGIFQDECKR